jgi:hypothetical protein
MIRRHAIGVVAMLAMGFMVAAPAEAGGTSGAVGVKKNATVRIRNNTSTQYYVVVVPASLAESSKFGESGTVGWAKNLGAALVNPGSTLSYPVPAGPGAILIQDAKTVPSSSSADLDPDAEGGYTVKKGKTVTKRIAAGPVIE